MNEETIECKGCGAKYLVSEHKTPMRDKESLTCEVKGCGTEIKSWNGGHWFTMDRIDADESK